MQKVKRGKLFQIFFSKKTDYLQGLSAFMASAVVNNFDRQVPSFKKCAILAGSAFEKCFKKAATKAGKTPEVDRTLIIVS